jgi:hypothetical protein
VQPQQLDRFQPKYAMDGSTDRAYDTGKSAKDAFAVLANTAAADQRQGRTGAVPPSRLE